MADTVLTLAQLESIFYTLTCQLLGLDPENSASFSKVRISWQTDGAPGWAETDDVVFLRITSANDPYIKQRETTYSAGTSSTANVTNSYTRAHTVHWLIYGPNSFENADLIRNGLFGADLSTSSLYVVLDIPAPVRAPELFGGRWWERSDLSATFYELVTRTGTVPTLASVNIQVKTEEGVTEDVNLTT